MNLLALLGAILVVLALTAGPAAAAYPGNNGRIAFQSDRDGNWEIYGMTATGASQTRLTDWAWGDFSPVWSPDGQKLAYTHESNLGLQRFPVLNVLAGAGAGAQSTLTGITNSPAWNATWSPDGTRIAWVRQFAVAVGDELWVSDADGSNASRIRVTDGSNITALRWSPDGTRFALSMLTGSGSGVDWSIYRLNADGSGNPAKVTESSLHDRAPDWSPDGRTIVFVRGIDAEAELYRVRPSGTGLTKLTSNSFREDRPVYSPDGKRIAFASERNGNWDIYTMPAGGGSDTRLTTDPGNDNGPDWQPRAVSPLLKELIASSSARRLLFTSSVPGRVVVSLQEELAGRKDPRARGRCVAPGRAPVPPRDRCTRTGELGKADLLVSGGRNAVPFSELTRQRLGSGCYRVTVAPLSITGREGRLITSSFAQGRSLASCR